MTVNFDMSTYTFTEGFVSETVCVVIAQGSTERSSEIQLSSTDTTAEGQQIKCNNDVLNPGHHFSVRHH